MRRLPGASPRYGCDLDAPVLVGLDLGIPAGALLFAVALRHGLTLDAVGLGHLQQRYGYPAVPWPFETPEQV